MAKAGQVGRRRQSGPGVARGPHAASRQSTSAVDPGRAGELAQRVIAALQDGDLRVAENLLGGVDQRARSAALDAVAASEQGGIVALRQLAQAPAARVAESALAALGRQHSPDAVTVLMDLALSLSKPLAKEARRELARLAASGLDVPQAPPPEPIFSPTQTGVVETRAIGTAIDGRGNQGVLLAFTHVPAGTYVATGVVSDTYGLAQFNVGRLTQTELQHEWGHWLDPHGETGIIGVEMPYDYVASVVQQAVERTRAQDLAMPPDYESWTEAAPRPARAYDGPPVGPELAAQAADAMLTRDDADALLNEPELRGWAFPFVEVQSFALRMHEAQTSAIVLSPEAQADRDDRIIGDAAEQVVTDIARASLARRLDVAAYVFSLSDRRDLAAKLLAAARVLRDTDTPLRSQPLVMALVARSVGAAMEAEVPASETGRQLLGQVVQGGQSEDAAPRG